MYQMIGYLDPLVRYRFAEARGSAYGPLPTSGYYLPAVHFLFPLVAWSSILLHEGFDNAIVEVPYFAGPARSLLPVE